MEYKTGDELVILVEDTFGYRDKLPRRLKIQVIGTCGDYHLCYVPPYDSHRDSEKISERTLNRFNAEKKFLGDEGLIFHRASDVIKHIPSPVGTKCDRCKEFINSGIRTEGVDFHCRACRENPWRLSTAPAV